MKSIFSFFEWLSPFVLLNEIAWIQKTPSKKARLGLYLWLAMLPSASLGIIYVLVRLISEVAKMVLA